MYKKYTTKYAGRTLEVEIGKYAKQANGSVMINCEGTTLLVAATASKEPKPGIDFFPLSIDYQEKLYSVGKIPGGYLKREGRPTDAATLVARAIDRPLRPFFPSELRNDVVIQILVLSVNPDVQPDVLGMIGSVISCMISDIPFNGPIGGVDVGLVDGKVVLNPDYEQRQKSRLYLTLAGTKEKITMIEAGANELTNEEMLNAIKEGHKEIIKVCEFAEKIAKEVGKEKFEIDRTPFLKDDQMVKYLKENYLEEMKEVLEKDGEDKLKLQEGIAKLEEAIIEKIYDEKLLGKDNLNEIPEDIEETELKKIVSDAITKLEKEAVRKLVTEEGKRVDKREIDEVRELTAEVSLLERVHGSALFSRGETQVMSIATLGKLSEEQRLDGIQEEETKRYMHHYNFPGFSVGEAKPSRSAGRREIGHGALAEKALVPVLPSKEEFPYAIRVVSEVLGSNGSTSQASVCGSSLALMDAGVPIKKAVAGISTGLFTKEDGSHVMVTDIQGLEDFFGEMDFKVAGTKDGITAIQVDIKNDGLTYEIIEEAFAKTLKARTMIINEVMNKAIKEPRKEVSKYAPKIAKKQISVDRIKDLIGAGGKNINKIIEETGVEIDIQDTGLVLVYSDDSEKIAKAMEMIEILTHEYVVGEKVKGIVSRITNFGAFIDLGGGREGLVHISKIANRRIDKVEDVLKEGQLVEAKVLEVDEDGKISLDMRNV